MNILKNDKSSDNISDLPTDKNEPSSEELEIVNTLFKTNNNKMYVILNEVKDALLVGILFIIFTLPQIDAFINKFIPFTQKSIYILILIKFFVMIIIYWCIKYFSRKN